MTDGYRHPRSYARPRNVSFTNTPFVPEFASVSSSRTPFCLIHYPHSGVTGWRDSWGGAAPNRVASVTRWLPCSQGSKPSAPLPGISYRDGASRAHRGGIVPHYPDPDGSLHQAYLPLRARAARWPSLARNEDGPAFHHSTGMILLVSLGLAIAWVPSTPVRALPARLGFARQPLAKPY